GLVHGFPVGQHLGDDGGPVGAFGPGLLGGGAEFRGGGRVGHRVPPAVRRAIMRALIWAWVGGVCWCQPTPVVHRWACSRAGMPQWRQPDGGGWVIVVSGWWGRPVVGAA